jgi:hypothetical protein
LAGIEKFSVISYQFKYKREMRRSFQQRRTLSGTSFQAQGCRVLWLIEADIRSTGKLHPRNETSSSLLNSRARNARLRERSNLLFQIVTHKIKFVTSNLSRAERGFWRWQGKDQPASQPASQPAMTGIHKFELEDITKKGPVRLGVFTCRQLRERRKSFALLRLF